MGGGFRREGTYIYLWLIHVDVWQRPTQYCKAIILQLKKKQTEGLKKIKFCENQTKKADSVKHNKTRYACVDFHLTTTISSSLAGSTLSSALLECWVLQGSALDPLLCVWCLFLTSHALLQLELSFISWLRNIYLWLQPSIWILGPCVHLSPGHLPIGIPYAPHAHRGQNWGPQTPCVLSHCVLSHSVVFNSLQPHGL